MRNMYDNIMDWIIMFVMVVMAIFLVLILHAVIVTGAFTKECSCDMVKNHECVSPQK